MQRKEWLKLKSKLKELFFTHDFNARNSTKLKKILRKSGLSGIGAYWCLIEKLYENDGEITIEEVELLAWELREDYTIFESVINTAFEVKDNKVISKGVKERIEERESANKARSEKARELAYARWQKTKTTIPDYMERDKNNKEREISISEKEQKELMDKVFNTKTKETKKDE